MTINADKDSKEKETLEGRQDTLGLWFKIATAAVVFGLLFEYVPEIIRAFQTGIFPAALIGPIFVREESETLLLPTVAIATEFMRLKISSHVTLNVLIPPQVLIVAVGFLP